MALPEDIGRTSQIRWVRPPDGWPADVSGGVSARSGGVSSGPFATLNLGARTGDEPGHIAENLRRLAEAAALPLDRAGRIRLEHGARVVQVADPGLTGQADGLVTTAIGLPLAITVADCIPLLLAVPGKAVAIAHCGWRGILAGVAPAAVELLAAAAGADRAELLAWTGPGIQPCCFHLPQDIARSFPSHSGPAGEPPANHSSVAADAAARPRSVDLPAAIALQLENAGLSPANVAVCRLCTSCRPDLFYSHRRDRGCTGRMLAWIARAPVNDPPVRE